MKRFLIALQFLTILPVKFKGKVAPEEMAGSLAYFPLVGALIGCVLALVSVLFGFLPSLVTAALILIASIVITGGMHLDGLADTCDGFYGSRSKEEILRIMRDSHIGAMGVIGLAVILIFKFSAFAAIPKSVLWKTLIMMAAFSRWAQALACYGSQYARQDGKAKDFVERATKKDILIAMALTLLLFAALMRACGVVVFGISTVIAYLFIRYFRKRIGGMTGDTIGALSESSEALILFLNLVYIFPWRFY
ncbi:MAG: adenosylcobinamide-GDP ribazoletransferase [Candidatus Omnitrophica bacterium]|nr:adenosylcobinamide-GDP ribazoletransferase [Candidatus Omnitrophota bacterium]